MTPADPPGSNTLKTAISPYLRQHADNPVHWREWTPEALAEAARRDVPILLSVGYAACHWCHVMAHESFEDHDVAAVMNRDFVCVKVDREERPDLDAVYMNATVALTGHGGWPMTCFLAPDGRPFFCGTYYPKPAFLQLLEAVRSAWTDRRAEVEQAGSEISSQLSALTSSLRGVGPPVAAPVCDQAVAAILADEDTQRGGFGRAPKFPPSMLLEALLRHHERTGARAALAAVERTAGAMARGGIYDQLAGGFARYSVDASWVVPHFEKMLYDNALLLRAYAHWARRTGDPLARRVAEETADFIVSGLATGDMFASSLDADAAGREGSTYVWTPEQLRDVLGDDDGRRATVLFGVTAEGTFEEGTSVLQLPKDPADTKRFARVRSALLKARGARVQPDRDDKAVTGWNGLAITALTEAGLALGRPDLVAAAKRCAVELLRLHLLDGRLRRASLGGRVGESAGILEDYAALAVGLLAVYQVDGAEQFLRAATGLLDTALELFADSESPGNWYDTAADAEQLVMRPADPLDGATPSGASLLTEALLAAGSLASAGDRYREAADEALTAHARLLARVPRSASHWLTVAESVVQGPLAVAVACDPAASELLDQARMQAPGGAVVIGGTVDSSPLLADRNRVGGADAAYVCRGQVCDLPVTGAEELAARVGWDWLEGDERGASEHCEPHRDVVTDRRGRGACVEELVVAEGLRPRVWPTQRVKHTADAVEHTADGQQHHCRDTGAVQQRAGEPYGHPAQQQIQRHAQPARRRRPQHLQRDTGYRTAPDDGQYQLAGVGRHCEYGKRCVAAGDEDEDHRVVGAFHPFALGVRLPLDPVIGRADGEHRHDRRGVGERGQPRTGGNHCPRHRHQSRAGDHRDHRRVEVDPARALSVWSRHS